MPVRRTLFNTIFWRAIPILLVLTISIMAFRQGVDVSDRGDIPDDNFFAQLYYAIGLFALGGMDLGMPTGGPVFWQRALILTYFLAPALAAFTVIEGLWRLIWARMISHWPWRNHIVVAGGGRVARAVVEHCRATFPGRNILVVEKNVKPSHVSHFSALKRVHLIDGDMTEKETAVTMQLQKAKCMLLLTNDELANVELAVQHKDTFQTGNGLPILVRVADLDLMERANGILGSETWSPCVNIHKAVAEKICRDSLQYMMKTEGQETLVFAGFGRFSQTYLRQFINLRGVEQVASIVIIDPDAELCWHKFFDLLPADQRNLMNEIPVLRKTGTQEDPRLWYSLLGDHGDAQNGEGKLVVLLGTNDDQSNLKVAMRVRDQTPDAYVMFRMFGASRFSKQVAQEMHLQLVDIQEELEHQIHFWIGELKRHSRGG